MILPDQTPVIGKGMATKRDNKINFFMLEFLVDKAFIFELYFSTIKHVKNLFFNFFVNKISGIDGIILPINEQKKAQAGDKMQSPNI